MRANTHARPAVAAQAASFSAAASLDVKNSAGYDAPLRCPESSSLIRLALAHRTFFETLLLIGIFCILVLDTFISVGDHSTLPRTAWIISFNSMVGTGVFLLYRRLRNPYRQLTANDINQLLDLSKDAISVMDLRSGRLVYANQATGKVFGLSAEQLLSEGLPDLFPLKPSRTSETPINSSNARAPPSPIPSKSKSHALTAPASG